MSPWAAGMCILLVLGGCSGANILGINPTASISHQLPFLIIMRALAERGHNVTIITTDPIKDPPKTLRQIDISFSYHKMSQINLFELSRMGAVESVIHSSPYAADGCSRQLESRQVHEFLRENLKFDVVVIEVFAGLCYLGMLQKMDYPPLVAFTSLPLSPSDQLFMGNPLNPSYFPEYFGRFSDHMSFWERLQNVWETLRMLYARNVLLTGQEVAMREHFGLEPRSLFELHYNFSLMLTCNHFSVAYPLPIQRNVVELTGLHVQRENKPLPQDIQEFLDGAEHGAIYFSLGSNLKSFHLPENIRTALLEAFSSLQQRVLWKWEDDELPALPSNMKVAKWLPQQDLLSHPNVRLFVTQGGLQSFNEAAYHAVPLLGIPFFGDQSYNVAKMVQEGIGVKLDFSKITKESVIRAVQTVLQNPSYQHNMRRFSAVFREHQEDSLQRAVWWLEYVVRHQGAAHLRPAALSLSWWQLLLLDVTSAVLLVMVVTGILAYKMTALIFRRTFKVAYHHSKHD